jgi:hypothetical protein
VQQGERLNDREDNTRTMIPRGEPSYTPDVISWLVQHEPKCLLEVIPCPREGELVGKGNLGGGLHHRSHHHHDEGQEHAKSQGHLADDVALPAQGEHNTRGSFKAAKARASLQDKEWRTNWPCCVGKRRRDGGLRPQTQPGIWEGQVELQTRWIEAQARCRALRQRP